VVNVLVSRLCDRQCSHSIIHNGFSHRYGTWVSAVRRQLDGDMVFLKG